MRFLRLLVLLLLSSCTVKNSDIGPQILSSLDSQIAIYDHGLDQDYKWTLSSEKSLNRYVANKEFGTKTISLIGQLDTITFTLDKADSIDIMVISDARDTFNTRIISGMKLTNKAPPKSDTIPFSLTASNNMVVPALLNDIDSLQLMLHTAAGEVNILASSSENLKSLNNFQSEKGAKSWGGENDFRFSEHNELSIGPFKWDDLTIYEDRFSGPESDGKFGLNLFEDRIVEIDFDLQHLIIHTTLPEYSTQYEKSNILFDRDMIFMPLRILIGELYIEHNFLLHSGYAGAALIDDVFVAEHLLDQKLETISERDLKDSFGNIIKTKKAILPQLNIKNFKLHNLPASFFSGSIGRQKISMLGGDIMKRFNIIIDMQESQIYLKPNKLYSAPYWQ